MPFFDLGGPELLLIAIIALIVVGPKDLPKLMRVVGRTMGKVRAAARQFKSGFDDMVRESELQEMQEKWDAHNEAIMRNTPRGADLAETGPPPPQKPPKKPPETPSVP